MDLKTRQINLLKKSVKWWNFYRKIKKDSVIDLSYANFAKLDLAYADLNNVNLRGSNLSRANLFRADLRHTNLTHINLSHADLSHVDFECANLNYANLCWANLRHSTLKDVNFGIASLSQADLRCADLDFSSIGLSSGILRAIFDEKHIIQLLYHAAKPCQSHPLQIVEDKDLKELLNSELFKKVVNKFHRVDEYGKFN